MILAATIHSLEIILGGAITTNQLQVNVEYTEVTSTTSIPGHQDSQSNGVSAVTILSAPGAAATYRVVKNVNVQQKDTVVATVTIRFNNNATLREEVVIVLQPGQTLSWSSENGWEVFSAQSIAASDTVAGNIEIAIQAEMEAATDNTRCVTPGRVQYHPGACKCWGKAVGAGTSLTVNWNITSVSDTGTGRLGVTIATDMSSVNYVIQCSLERSVTSLTATGVEDNNIRNASQTATAFEVESYDHTAVTMAAQDPLNYYFAAWGDQA